MQRRLLNSFGFVFFIIFVAYFFGLMDYDKSSNPDIINYIANFNNKNWSYDIGFEYYQHILRDVFVFDFNSFWFISLIFIAVLYVLSLSTSFVQIPFAVINFLFLAETFGTQIRYFIAALFFVFSLKYLKRFYLILGMMISIVFHYGVVLLSLNFLAAKIAEKNEGFLRKKSMLIFAGIFVFYFLSTFFVQILLPYTRFSYYAGSFYMTSKSLSSLAYIFISFSFLYFFFLRNEIKEDFIFIYALLLLYVVLCTSAIAVLSGRLLLVYLILEPLVAKTIYSKDKKLYLLFFLICLIKAVPSVNSFFAHNF